MNHTYEVKPEPGYSTVWVNGVRDFQDGDVIQFMGHRLVVEIEPSKQVVFKNHDGESTMYGVMLPNYVFPCQVERFTDRPVDWLGGIDYQLSDFQVARIKEGLCSPYVPGSMLQAYIEQQAGNIGSRRMIIPQISQIDFSLDDAPRCVVKKEATLNFTLNSESKPVITGYETYYEGNQLVQTKVTIDHRPGAQGCDCGGLSDDIRRMIGGGNGR